MKHGGTIELEGRDLGLDTSHRGWHGLNVGRHPLGKGLLGGIE